MKTGSMRDCTATQVEISRLRRIENKVDGSAQQAIARRIRELQIELQGCSPMPGSNDITQLRSKH